MLPYLYVDQGDSNRIPRDVCLLCPAHLGACVSQGGNGATEVTTRYSAWGIRSMEQAGAFLSR